MLVYFARYYFVEGHALNDRPRVAKVASEELCKRGYDMSEDLILEFLNSNEGRNEINNALSALNQLGIHSIPKFIIEGQTLVDGAAHWKHHLQIFREIESRGYVLGGPLFGDILGVSNATISRGSHEEKLQKE